MREREILFSKIGVGIWMVIWIVFKGVQRISENLLTFASK
ncbi:hypothetical protein HMPREF1366_03050 [Enterococcus faecium ERV26]|nr:hypothetical protein HMPREF1381_02156 [Enterococcus faecium R501]EJX81959.1 hypothetical protein HMPREF1368_02745 [Enterococcus faecium ERV69]EJX87706.1 hypothetical protein HMPREF1366_03050 [Enterococcus faecium ERV26]